jgi:hypothetical protein
MLNMPATRCGRFEVKSELGKGSMATVYEAADPARLNLPM